MSTIITLIVLALAAAYLVWRLVRMIRRNGGEAPDAASAADCARGCATCATGCATPITTIPQKRRPLILYYEDEELDRFRGRPANLYTEMETQEFREVLDTLDDADVSGWITSIHRRGIHFPEGVAEEVTHRLSRVAG